jgi:hypothetical protein
MTGSFTIIRTAWAAIVGLILCVAGESARGAEVNTTRTNWMERWITNNIEVRMPLNRFVDEYHTNWVTELHTNVVQVFTTNRLTRTFTNFLQVDAFQTNLVTAYQTNLQRLDLTNWQTAIVMTTNQLTRTVTNHFEVDAFRTNIVTAYQTNWKTLDLTNWQTVIVMMTNWVTQPVTNVVEISMPGSAVTAAVMAPKPLAEQKEAEVGAPSSPLIGALAGSVVLEAARTSRPPNGNQVEVQLTVRGSSEAAPPVVQQWRVERDDRTILCFGQDQQFKRELPAGTYKVEAKFRRGETGPVLTERGTLLLTPREAVLQQKLTAKN